MRHENVQLKQLKDVSKPQDKKSNWWFLVNDHNDTDIKGYSNQDLQDLQQKLQKNPEATFVNVAGDEYPPEPNRLKNAVFTLIGDDEAKPSVPTSSETKTSVPAKQNGVQDYTRVPDEKGLTREEGMLVIGIWTRGITSGKTSEQVGSYCSDALIDYRNKNKGDDDVPF